ncbi:MAG: NifU family protein [Candidatus Binatia bacterium]
MAQERDLQQVGSRIEHLLAEVRSMVSPPAWARVDQLVRSILELYGDGLRQIVSALGEEELAAAELRARVLSDPLVVSLLLLHGLHPQDLPTRVRIALERVRPYLGSHGGDVELLSADEQSGVVRLRMTGSCDGCPSSMITLKLAIEGAVRELAPDVLSIQVGGLDLARATAEPEPRESGHAGEADSSAWVALEQVPELAPGRLTAADVHGARIVLCRVAERLYAYRNGCPSCGSAIDGARLDGERLTCPCCGHGFDVRRAGRSVEGRELHLDPLPLLQERGGVRIAFPAS